MVGDSIIDLAIGADLVPAGAASELSPPDVVPVGLLGIFVPLL